MKLVGRGKVGLVLEDESEQPVAIDGQQPMMGAPSAVAEANTTSNLVVEPHTEDSAALQQSVSACTVFIRLMSFKTGWSAGTLQRSNLMFADAQTP